MLIAPLPPCLACCSSPGHECLRTLRGHDHSISAVLFLPNTEHLVSASRLATPHPYCSHGLLQYDSSNIKMGSLAWLLDLLRLDLVLVVSGAYY